MIIKLTLATLVLVLVAVIAISYYVNKEGFEDITNTYYKNLSKNLGGAMNTVPPVTISDSGSNQEVMKSLPTEVAEKPALMTPPQATIDTSTIPQRNDIVPQVSISGSGYDAMSAQQKADLLRDIQKAVRNELLVNRNTTPVVADTKNKTETDSTAQGQEYESSCYKDSEYRCPKNPDGTCPPVPDMSQYIKKDAIPCYGCVLDY